MRKSWIFALFLLSLYSCGSYTLQTNKGYEIKSILALTEAGDTISVPYKDFIRDRYDNYTRFNWNNNWYWNNWRYDYTWRWNYYWWNTPNNNYWYNTPRYYGTPVRPKVKPKNVPRPGVVPGVLPKTEQPRIRINQGRRNETYTTNPRETQQTQTRSNGRRSWNRQVVPTQPTRSRITPSSQPRQIRGGSRQSGIQQTQSRGSSSQQGSRSSVRRQN